MLLLLAFLIFDFKPALAHSPHDDVTALEISPTYSIDKTLFIIVRGNLFKSQDGGTNWQRIEKGLDTKNSLYRPPAALAIAQDSSQILYLASSGDGIYKSGDGGNSWKKINQGLDTLDIDLVSVSPDSSEVVLATGVKKSLYQSKNGGKTWQKIIDDNKITAVAYLPDTQGKHQIAIGDHLGSLYTSADGGNSWQQLGTILQKGRIRAIAVSPNFLEDRMFFVGTKKGGIYKTIDGGRSWKEANQGILDKSIMSLAVSPNYLTDLTVFASTWSEGVFQSNDGGNTWKIYKEGLARNAQAEEYNLPHFRDLKISDNFSQDKTIFLASFTGLFKSINGGLQWRELVTLSSAIVTGIEISPDYHQDGTVAISTYLGGAYLTGDRGATWTALEVLLEHSKTPERLFDIVFSPDYPSDNTLFSTTWTHFLKSKDKGKTWHKIPLDKRKFFFLQESLSSKPVMAISPNFTKDRTIYLGTEQGHIFRSTDGGSSFSVIANLKLNIASLAISPNFSNDRTLYAGCYSVGAYKSVDGGFTWQPANSGLPLIKKEATRLALSSDFQVDKTLFAGTAQGLFTTEDGGNSWVKAGGTSQVEGGYIEALALSPNYISDRTLIVSVRGGGLFKSVDGGETFTLLAQSLLNNNDVLSNLRDFPAVSEAIKFSPAYASDRTLYGFSNTKLFKSEDGGNSWQAIKNPSNLPTPKDSRYYFAAHPESQAKNRGESLFFIPSPIASLIVAAIAGLLSYFSIGYLGLEKKLPFPKSQVKAGGAFVVFIAAFMLCWILSK